MVGYVWSRHAVRWTLRWFSYLDDQTTHEDHFSCDRDGNSAIRFDAAVDATEAAKQTAKLASVEITSVTWTS